MLRFQSLLGGERMIEEVQSPALETMRENPLSSVSGTAAKACQSRRGFRDMEMPCEKAGWVYEKWRRVAWVDRGRVVTGTRRRVSHGRMVVIVLTMVR